MPFTFSHPAAILPFTYLPKKWISITALAAGSMVPDFEYFLRMKNFSSFSHTWTGLFWFDLPLAIILSFIFHQVVRDKLIDNLPFFLQKKFTVFKGFEWVKYFKQYYAVVVASILIGTATHIIWDNFTHEYGQFVQYFDSLKNRINIAGTSIRLYKLLQHLSTLIGGLIVIYSLLQLPSEEKISKQKSILPFWISVGIIAIIVVAIRLLTSHSYRQYANIIVTIISGCLIGLVLTAKWFPKTHNR